MRVGVIDVGANTLRLLVATQGNSGGVDPVREDRRQLGLGEEIERCDGLIDAEKIEEAAAVARTHVRRARKLHCDRIEVLVTSPGRQARNSHDLVEAIRDATGVPVRVLDADEEGALAWRGAIAMADEVPESVAVCDVGGGSVQIVVGTSDRGPAWSTSVDVGSLRLTRRALKHDPPEPAEIDAAREIVSAAFESIVPPLPISALATGGTARALRRVVGRELDSETLADAVRKLSRRASREIAKEFGVERARARTLTGGALLFSEVQKRLGVPMTVARGGLREGAVLALFHEAAAATA